MKRNVGGLKYRTTLLLRLDERYERETGLHNAIERKFYSNYWLESSNLPAPTEYTPLSPAHDTTLNGTQ